METEKLFWQDSYMKEGKSKVLNIDGKEVILDRTILFAFSGGQESDSGKIDGMNVLDSREEENKIIHTLETSPGFKLGDYVNITLDWNKRYKIMKLHSALHIVAYEFEKITGIKDLIGSNVTHEKGRLDYNYNNNVNDILELLSKNVNERINKDDKVLIYIGDDGKRIWESDDIKMACSGTHIRSTKEIGKIKLKRKNIGAGKERIEATLTVNQDQVFL